MLCSNFVENDKVVLEKKIFKVINDFSLLPLGKEYGLSFEQSYFPWIPFNQECFVPGLIKIDEVVLEKKIKSEKFIHVMTASMTMMMTKDKFPSEKLTWTIGSVLHS